jgi:hypothetical protein
VSHKIRVGHDRFELTLEAAPDRCMHLLRRLAALSVAGGLLGAILGYPHVAMAAVPVFLVCAMLEGQARPSFVVRLDTLGLTLLDRRGTTRIGWRQIRNVERGPAAITVVTDNQRLHLGDEWTQAARDSLWEVLEPMLRSSRELPEQLPPEELTRLISTGRGPGPA